MPVITDGDCYGCKSFCRSRRGSGSDETCNIFTSRNSFYMTVYAAKDYGGTFITTNVNSNILRVEEIGK